MDSLADLRESWEMRPGDRHEVETRYRRDAWWFTNQRGDSLFVEPRDVAVMLDFLATPPEPADGLDVELLARAVAFLRSEYGWYIGPMVENPADVTAELIAREYAALRADGAD